MIDITFTESDGKYTMRCHGHSGYAKKGADIVCAAATMLAYTYAQAVQNLFDGGMLKNAPDLDFADGAAMIQAEAHGEDAERLRTTIYTVQAGAMCLASNYPQYVTVHIR